MAPTPRHPFAGVIALALFVQAALIAQDPTAKQSELAEAFLATDKFEDHERLFAMLGPKALEILVDRITTTQDKALQRDRVRNLGKAWRILRATPQPALDRQVGRLLKLARPDPKAKKTTISKRLQAAHRDTPLPLATCMALGQLASYLGETREPLKKLLEAEMNDRWGFHIKEIRNGYFRLLIKADAPIAELCEHLAGNNGQLRFHAAQALQVRGREAREAIPALLQVMEEPPPKRVELNVPGVVNGSTGFGDFEGLKDEACRALVRIAPEDKRCAEALLRVARRCKDAASLRPALRHLGTLGPRAKEAALPVSELLEHSDVEVARNAAMALGMIGMADPQVLEALEQATQRKEKIVALTAAATLRSLKR